MPTIELYGTWVEQARTTVKSAGSRQHDVLSLTISVGYIKNC